MRPGNAWRRPLNFATTQLPQPPPQLYSLNQQRDLPSKYMFVPHAEIPQLHYRQDPRLAHKLNWTCSLCSNLSVNNSLQPAARETVNYETGISSPAQNVSASPPFIPRQGTSHTQILRSPVSLGGLSPSWAEQRDTPQPSNTTQHTHGRNTVPIPVTKIHCSRPNFLILQHQEICRVNSQHAPTWPSASQTETRKLTHRTSD
jgi:hypothetical protein